jgi:hypothetical protein
VAGGAGVRGRHPFRTSFRVTSPESVAGCGFGVPPT